MLRRTRLRFLDCADRNIHGLLLNPMPSPVELQLLFECVRQPWSSLAQLAAAMSISREEAARCCERLVQQALLQRTTQSLSHLPRTICAPTKTGVMTCLQATHLTQHQLGFTPERFWALRAGIEVTAEINAMCASTALNAAPARVVWETYIQRRNRKRPLYLHGRIALFSGDGVQVFYLLNDRGEGPVTVWYRHLRYFTLWARRQPAYFPTVLVLTTRPFRAWALLALARMSGGDNAIKQADLENNSNDVSASKGKANYAITVERAAAIRDGLLAVAACGHGWQALLPNNTLVTIDPFTQPPTPIEVYELSVHASACSCLLPSIMPDAVKHATPLAELTATRMEDRRRTSAVLAIPDLVSPSNWFKAMQAVESLGDSENKVLAFLCRHPVCPASTIAVFTNLREEMLPKVLDTLQAAGSIEPAVIDQAQTKVRRRLPTLWLAREEVVWLLASRRGLDPDLAIRRYHFFASDHTRRPYHTLAAHLFFEWLRRYCLQRGRAARYLDAESGKPNEGQVSYYDLAVYDAELIAADHYRDGDHIRTWRPDGYGALRCGTDWTRFWLEIDGTPDIPSRAGLETWLGKLGGQCDYYASMKWRLRYPTFPRLLIVTTNEQNLSLARDALITSVRVRSLPVPEVYMAPVDDISRYGAMARTWHNVATEDDEKCYAFINAAPSDVARTVQRN